MLARTTVLLSSFRANKALNFEKILCFLANDGQFCKCGGLRFSSAAVLQQSSRNAILKSPLSDVDIPKMTVSEYVWKDLHKWANKTAVTCGITGKSYTYSELRERSGRFAASLHKFGFRKGDVIGIILPNGPEFLIVFHGAVEAGLVVSTVNPVYTSEEISRQLNNAAVKVMITDLEHLKKIQEAGMKIPTNENIIVVDGTSENCLSMEAMMSDVKDVLPQQKHKPSWEETVILPYSSGTTGLPKGVDLSHKNLVSNMCQIGHPHMEINLPTTDTHQDTVIAVIPFFHIFGLTGIMNSGLSDGIHIVTIPKFTTKDYINCLKKYKPSVLVLVPPLLQFLATNSEVTEEHLCNVRVTVCGAAAATEPMIHQYLKKITRPDARFDEGYGLTETSPTVTAHGKIPIENYKYGSIGRLLSLTEAKLVNIETGLLITEPYQHGELCFRGPQVMTGYKNNEKATKEIMDDEGFLHTGDIAYYDNDEYFYIVGRSKELIKVKGNQVSPTELEVLIRELTGVDDVGVVGIPDARAGEVPKAYVKLKEDSKLTEKEILDYVASNTAHFKHLAGGVKFVDSIPKSASGKILRHELKQL